MSSSRQNPELIEISANECVLFRTRPTFDLAFGRDGACAVGNAIATLTGVRLRELPFSPERVRGALGV